MISFGLSAAKTTIPTPQLLRLLQVALLCFTSVSFAAPALNGMATHSEFNKERFIAALYSETLSSDATAILSADQAKRIELRITTNSLSARRLNKMWIEGMAINNSGAVLAEQADNMVSLTQLFKNPLILGDQLVIDYQPGQGSQVKVNDVLLGTIPSPGFINVLLRTWIGSVPLSSEFRNGLLTAGKVDANLQARFASLAPNPARKMAISAWVNPDAAIAAETTTVDTTTDGTAIDGTVTAAPPVVTEEPTAPETATSTAEISKPTIAAPTLAVAPPTATQSEPEAAAADASLSEEEQQEEEGADDEPVLTAASLLSRQMYHSNLMRWTYQHIRYPKRAVERGFEGSVRLSVTIDRQGNPQKVSNIASSGYNILDQAALNAVEKATPFPAVPDDVSGETFQFTLPIVFRLPK